MTAVRLPGGKLYEVFYWSFRKSWVMVIRIPPLREWSRSKAVTAAATEPPKGL